MAFEVIDSFLLRHERLDIFSLHLVKKFLDVASYDLDYWQDGTMTIGAEWAIDHYFALAVLFLIKNKQTLV
jgi:hypothetical protein